MADYGGQQVVSPYYAMSCKPVITIDPLDLQGHIETQFFISHFFKSQNSYRS